MSKSCMHVVEYYFVCWLHRHLALVRLAYSFLAIELARRGYQVVGLDISASFVQIAQANAREVGVAVDFQCIVAE